MLSRLKRRVAHREEQFRYRWFATSSAQEIWRSPEDESHKYFKNYLAQSTNTQRIKRSNSAPNFQERLEDSV